MDQRRRSLTMAAAAIGCAGLLPLSMKKAVAADFTYKLGNDLPASHPLNIRAKEAADKIRTETGGRLDLQIFPNNQLGGDTDMLSQVRAGALEFFMNSGINVLSTMIPSASIYGLGFIFTDYPSVWRSMDGDLGNYVRTQITKAGLVPMEKMWDNGFRNMTTSTKPINTPADLAGLKVRVPVGALWTSMFRSFGASPTSINFSEIYSALQTHVVDAQETPLALIYTAKIFEVQKYCSLTGHMWDGFFCVANKAAWDKLPPDIQAIARKHLNDAAVAERADLEGLGETYQRQLTEKGMVINKPDRTLFRKALVDAGFYKEWRQKYGEDLWHLLEKSVGPLS